MDFGALPPEVNSGLMYAGPGAGPMMAAASTWNSLGVELRTTASSYESVISMLTGDEWLGPTSAAMAAAVAPYVAWMNTTAAAAEHAGVQAMASAAAFEAAFAMTVPPPVIAANRAALAVLVATNVLGQNMPAIAANEVLYAEMWAQDATAMYGYAASSAAAGMLSPLTSPTPTTNPAGLAGQAAAVAQAGASGTQTGLSQLISTLPTAVQGLAAPLAGSAASPSGLAGLNAFFGNAFLEGATNLGAWNMFAGIYAGVAAARVGSGLLGGAATVATGGLGETVLASAVGSTGAADFAGAPVLAGLGQASSAGALSVPASWSVATPASAGPTTLAGAGWTAGVEESTPVAMPAGMPAVASAGRGGVGFGAPRYGFKPTVMPKSVVV
ncbi:PPE family protein [Mycobacterium shimoidei]|uniref:PPE family protein PPE43 [Mycobacterium tuberculosis H37Rv] n=1 Tax=Mycobacterium shimoidei TaxID=29313 RepID=A0A1E3T0Q6_MYCSH|nr:PPE family protein [Mycobacterium shimoidei]MCV7257024.1 PPE family protein [Mycobacterium shimoidei]ODR07403.1 hypothetical protein BHQ16_21235 [Mycobacterium shimoidei]ORW77083.1 hypothetical protein AWC26_19810 [Mycobacterium shimoidei]SRX95772.1 PPE family protein PPE43 [Mycobacterium tuberculosis H37Rv] [Mycobacterium shimoidei]